MPREFGYTRSARPTDYRGLLFDSKLEATWAAFFDACGWQWEYHPAAYEFPDWEPDFMLAGHYRPILVEVAPVSAYPQETGTRISAHAHPLGIECLILGDLMQYVTEADIDASLLGWFAGHPHTLAAPWEGWDECLFHSDDDAAVKLGNPDFSEYWGSWAQRMCGAYDGDGLCRWSTAAPRYWRKAKQLLREHGESWRQQVADRQR